MLDARGRHRHISQTMIALHLGGLLTAGLAAFLASTTEPVLWRRALLTCVMVAAVELILFLPALARFRTNLGTLVESEAAKRGSLEAALDPVIVTDASGMILEFNAAAEKVFAYRAEAARGQGLPGLLLPEPWASRFREGLCEYFDTGDSLALSRRIEIEAVRSSGQRFAAELSVTPVRGLEAVFFNVCIRDITDRKQVERWLIEAREAALAASRVKSEFLANMSHEIRTPMNTVIGMTSLLAGTRLTAEQKEYVGSTRDAAQSLLSLLNEILDLTKVEAGKMELELIEFELPALARDTAEMVSYQAGQKKIGLKVEVQASVPPFAKGDPGRIRQVLLNLLSNAVKFTQQGQVTLKVSESDGQVHFEVEDTGAGVPESVHPRLFQAFSQADSSTTRKFGGSGLGLAICRKLVTLMGGEIGFDSREGQGSRFWFSLPLVAGSAPAKNERRADAAGSALIAQGRRILVVEDNAVNSKMTIRMLEKLGFQGDPAGNGIEALAAIARSHYDLVLMDCQMPELDGFQATAEVRSAENSAGGRRLPIIALSGNVMQADRIEALASGMDDFLAKPVTFEELALMLQKWLAAPAETPAPPPVVDPRIIADLKTLEREGTPSFLRELIDTFNGSVPERLSRMREALAASDSAGLAKSAHTLKTASASVGAMSMSALCRELEAAGKQGLARDFARLLAGIESAYQQAREALEREIT